MNEEIVDRVLSDEADTSGDGESEGVWSTRKVDGLAGLLNIIAAGMWTVIGGVSGWSTGAVFGFTASDVTFAAAGMVVWIVLLRHLPVSDGVRRQFLAIFIALGWGIIAAGILFGADAFGAALVGSVSGEIR